MARKTSESQDLTDGAILFENLDRLGYVERVARSSVIAAKVSENTDRPISRQRVLQLINARRISPETIEHLAKGLGVKPADLTRKPVK